MGRDPADADVYEAVLETPNSFIGVLDPDGTLRRANRTALEFADAAPNDVEGDPFPDTPWWDHSAELQDRLRSWIDRAAEGEYVEYEAPHVAPDGTRVVVDGVLRPVTDDEGTVVTIIAEGRNVTEQRRRQRRIAEQRAQLEKLNRINETLRAVHQHIVRADDRATLEQSVCDCLVEAGVYSGAWIGRYDPHTERIEPTTWAEIDDDHLRTIELRADDSPAGGGPAGRAVADGEIRTVQDVSTAPEMAPWRDALAEMDVESVAAIPIRSDGEVRGVLGVWANRAEVFDEAEREALSELGLSVGGAFATLELRSELRRQNERLERFAAVVSHDLRNPLTVAAGELERAPEDEHVAEARAALDRMESLIEDVLTLAHSGADVKDPELVALDEISEACWDAVATGAASLVVETDATVWADRSRLRQLLENLVRNAIEHGAADEPAADDPSVTVRVGALDDGDGFYVADDGPGIPADRRDEVFADGYTTTSDGTGLGLTIVSDIARGHGWSVEATESADGGARFEIRSVEID